MAVFDCFTYFDELDVLELRMRELWDCVDVFVAVEANITFAGAPKPYWLTEHVATLGSLAEKLRIFRVDDLPVARTNRWPTEIRQRNAIRDALREIGAQPSDTILLSDVDEIPRADAVRAAAALLEDDQVLAFELDVFWYRLDLLFAERTDWRPSRACRGALLDVLTPSEIRAMYRPPETVLGDAGWHFSYLAPRGGSDDLVQRKLAAFSHHEVTAVRGVDWPQGHRALTTHLGDLLMPVDVDRLPAGVRADRARWEPFRQFPDGPSPADLRAFRAARSKRFWDRQWRRASRARNF